MKRVLMIFFVLICTVSLNAERYKIGDGLTLITYGNTAVIEDDNTQQTISLSINRRTDSYGQTVYDIMCGNKYTKGIIKQGLKDAIAIALPITAAAIGESFGGPAGQAVGATIAVKITPYVNTIASYIYDDVCTYFENKNL